MSPWMTFYDYDEILYMEALVPQRFVMNMFWHCPVSAFTTMLHIVFLQCDS